MNFKMFKKKFTTKYLSCLKECPYDFVIAVIIYDLSDFSSIDLIVTVTLEFSLKPLNSERGQDKECKYTSKVWPFIICNVCAMLSIRDLGNGDRGRGLVGRGV